MRTIRSVNLMVTDRCDRGCPHCCCRSTSDGAHATLDALRAAGDALYRVERVHITGGEPTLHPEFARFPALLREWFGCRELTIETNARSPRETVPMLRQFDRVYISYTTPERTGVKSNLEDVQVLRKLLSGGPTLIEGFVNHAPDVPGGGNPCGRGTGVGVGWARGLLYPCCVAAAVEGAVGIRPSPGWRERISHVEPPCGKCRFST